MNDASLRVDRWLFFTRFYKTRSLAAAAVSGGHIRLNGERARPASQARVGDRIEIVREQVRWVIDVKAIPARRGPAREAQACYEEDPASAEARAARLDSLRADRMSMPRTDGRPDKHTRRKLRDRNRTGH
jgi:ribosome-associated heat shock protein Hsp15